MYIYIYIYINRFECDVSNWRNNLPTLFKQENNLPMSKKNFFFAFWKFSKNIWTFGSTRIGFIFYFWNFSVQLFFSKVTIFYLSNPSWKCRVFTSQKADRLLRDFLCSFRTSQNQQGMLGFSFSCSKN